MLQLYFTAHTCACVHNIATLEDDILKFSILKNGIGIKGQKHTQTSERSKKYGKK